MRLLPIIALLLIAGCARPAAEQAGPVAPAPAPAASLPAGNPAVGGKTVPVTALIADTLASAPTLSHVAGAVAAAGLADTLRAAGPFTLFAPSDEAFARLQPGTIEALLKPENRPALVKLVGLHLVPERLTATDLMRRVAAGGGRATLTTVAGEALTVTSTRDIVTLTDAGGNRSYVEVADVRQANGVLHVVNGVLVPRLN